MLLGDDGVMRRLLGLVGALTAVLSVHACYLGPDPVQYAALAVVDGRPTAVVAVCGRPTVKVEVYRNDDDRQADLYEWSVTVTLPTPVRDVDVELLGAPRPGWEITPKQTESASPSGGLSFSVVPLTAFEPGHHYTLTSATYGPEGSSASMVTFTTDDLSRIGPGQVLSAVDHRHSKVISRDSFIKQRCG
jgi:hypothetical protein